MHPNTINLQPLAEQLPDTLSLLWEADYLGLSFNLHDLEGVLDGFRETRSVEPQQLWVSQEMVVTETVLDYARQIQAGEDVEPPHVIVLEDGRLVVWDRHASVPVVYEQRKRQAFS